MNYQAPIIILSLLLVWFGSDIGRVFLGWNEARNKRLLNEQRHKQEMEKLAVKKELLLLDPHFEFDQKLRVASNLKKENIFEFKDDDITYDEKFYTRKL